MIRELRYTNVTLNNCEIYLFSTLVELDISVA